MTSTARSAMRLASSWMVIASGIMTSRAHLLRRHLEALRLLLEAFGAAAEGGDRAGAFVLLVQGVGKRQLAAALLGVGLGAGRRGALAAP